MTCAIVNVLPEPVTPSSTWSRSRRFSPATRSSIACGWSPAGDQPQAIEDLVAGLKRLERDQVLLGVTGSGKTFTMAHVIQHLQRPALILAPNKTLAAQLYG